MWKPSLKSSAVLLALPLLTGCIQDTASYEVNGDRKHAITLMRSQPWFWDNRLTLSITVSRSPECIGGGEVKGVARDAELAFYLAPDEYPERMFILNVEDDAYAVSTFSCRVQKFETKPANLGEKLGTFRETDGAFRFEAAEKAK